MRRAVYLLRRQSASAAVKRCPPGSSQSRVQAVTEFNKAQHELKRTVATSKAYVRLDRYLIQPLSFENFFQQLICDHLLVCCALASLSLNAFRCFKIDFLSNMCPCSRPKISAIIMPSWLVATDFKLRPYLSATSLAISTLKSDFPLLITRSTKSSVKKYFRVTAAPLGLCKPKTILLPSKSGAPTAASSPQ